MKKQSKKDINDIEFSMKENDGKENLKDKKPQSKKRKRNSLRTFLLVILCICAVIITVLKCKSYVETRSHAKELMSWLSKGVPTEALVEESGTPFVTFPNSLLPQSSFPPDGKHQVPSEIVYYPCVKEDKLILHFKFAFRYYKYVDIFNVTSPSGKKIPIATDPYNPSFYFIELSEEGTYTIKYRFYNDILDPEHLTTYTSFYYLKD